MTPDQVLASWKEKEATARERLLAPGIAPKGQADAGRQVAVPEGSIVGPDGKLYAHATTICLIFDQPGI